METKTPPNERNVRVNHFEVRVNLGYEVKETQTKEGYRVSTSLCVSVILTRAHSVFVVQSGITTRENTNNMVYKFVD